MACGATLKRSLEFDPLHSPSHQRGSPKRRRCMPMTISPAVPPTKQHQLNPSPFLDVSPKLSSEQIAANICAEIKRMQRRRQLQFPLGSAVPSTSHTPPHTEALNTSQTSSFLTALSPCKRDVPLFTFKQVGLVCDRMLKEREEQIKQEYNKVLNDKLAEQYEAFLKFNHDQIRKRFGERPAASYVS